MRSSRRLALGLLVTLLSALPADAGRAYRVRTYPFLRASDSTGDREPGSGTFWFAHSEYDNPTGGQIPKVVRLTTSGAASTWLLDPAAQSFAPTVLRRDAARDVTWILVPLFAEGNAALYSLAPATGAVTRTLLPFPATELALDAAGVPWVSGTGKIAKLAGTALTLYELTNFAGGGSRIDAAGRLWLESDNRSFRSFDTASAQLSVWADAANGMRSRAVDATGKVWAAAEDQTRLLSFDPATRVKTSWPLVLTAANWAGIGVGTGGDVHLASAYGPHVLVSVPSQMSDATSVTLASPEVSTVTGTTSTPARTTLTAARTDATTIVVTRLFYAESDGGRHLFRPDGIGYSSLLWSDGSELLVGGNPVEWWQPVTGSFTTRAVLPAVVEVRPADPVSNFLTEVALTNVDADAPVTLTFRTASESFTVSLSVSAGATRVLPNAVQALRDLGAPSIPAGASGTLTATFTNGHGLMTARVYTLFGNDTVFPAGSTTGLAFTSVDPARKVFVERVTLNGLKATPEFRTNVSVANLCGATEECPPISLTATFLDDAAGTVIGESDLQVPPNQLGQLNAPLAGFGGSGETYSVRIQPYSAGFSGYDAYATVISSVVKDAAFIRASAVANSATPTLPVVTDAAGSGTRFTSEAAITSTYPVTETADVTFTSAVSGKSVTEALTLEPGRGVRWPNAVDHFRGIAPDKVAANDYGPVRIAFRQYATGFASSRTTATNGTGLAFTATDPFIERASRRKRIAGLKQTGAFRTNLAVVHLGATTNDAAATISVKVTVTNAQGQVVGSPLTRTLSPGQLFQWNRILSDAVGVTGEGYVATIERTAGQDAFEAYATIIDNVSSDSAFLRAE